MEPGPSVRSNIRPRESKKTDEITIFRCLLCCGNRCSSRFDLKLNSFQDTNFRQLENRLGRNPQLFMVPRCSTCACPGALQPPTFESPPAGPARPPAPAPGHQRGSTGRLPAGDGTVTAAERLASRSVPVALVSTRVTVIRLYSGPAAQVGG